MPELAEVEFYRKQWNPGVGDRVTLVKWHRAKRVFRGSARPASLLQGLILRRSLAHGKQMLFEFAPAQVATGSRSGSGRAATSCWLTIHLGMTGKLRVEPLPFQPGKHDHLAVFQKDSALIYSDPRQFGRVAVYAGSDPPAWWLNRSPAPHERGFTLRHMSEFLRRHGRLPIKAALLHQKGFPGIGNWMADEILWQARVQPKELVARLPADAVARIWRVSRSVCRTALRTIGRNFSDPPRGWLFHSRWSRKGKCPRHEVPLRCATVGGRTTVWCATCQG